jgi:hypothetical protein
LQLALTSVVFLLLGSFPIPKRIAALRNMRLSDRMRKSRWRWLGMALIAAVFLAVCRRAVAGIVLAGLRADLSGLLVDSLFLAGIADQPDDRARRRVARYR